MVLTFQHLNSTAPLLRGPINVDDSNAYHISAYVSISGTLVIASTYGHTVHSTTKSTRVWASTESCGEYLMLNYISLTPSFASSLPLYLCRSSSIQYARRNIYCMSFKIRSKLSYGNYQNISDLFNPKLISFRLLISH